MEVLGATAATAQLLGLCTQCGRAAAHITRSYSDAPKEIEDLSHKAELLQLRIQQLGDRRDGESGANTETFLPSAQSSRFLDLLKSQHKALTEILEGNGSGRELGKSSRARWATIDRLKVRRVMGKVAEINRSLDQMILEATL
jgi:hypothetical protein